MSFEPCMWATFCDDIRQEAGNKLSYMGIYGPNLVVAEFPTTLSKLCCVLSVRMPATTRPKKVAIKLLRDEEVILESEATAQELPHSQANSNENDSGEMAITLVTIAQMLSFQITGPAKLHARAIIDGKELRGGALELQAATTGEGSAPE